MSATSNVSDVLLADLDTESASGGVAARRSPRLLPVQRREGEEVVVVGRKGQLRKKRGRAGPGGWRQTQILGRRLFATLTLGRRAA